MLIDRLTEDMKSAMKGREELRLAVLRLTLSEAQNARIEKGEDLTDAEVVQVIRRAAKRRIEASEQFREGNRDDLADKEAREAEILEAYLPQQLSGEALEKIVAAAIEETGATSMKEMGAVMKAAMAGAAGQADGKAVQEIVKRLLSGQVG